jgi:1-deoxy-D-xylulose-5-phosphate reductoisomerase
MGIGPSPSVVAAAAPRSISILGSTGSVGTNTVDLLLRNPLNYTVESLTANRNVDLLAEQAEKLHAKFVAIADPDCYKSLKSKISDSTIEVAAGDDAVNEAARRNSDVVIASIVGAAGLKPTLEAVRRGAIIGLANKECLVTAGDIFVKEVALHNANLIPVDSEHSAIYQVFDFENYESVDRIILTASGGPFRTFSSAEMETVSLEQALAHPNWDMGAKISIDSATMMNKGLELIEAYHLFPVSESMIDILVHPQSVIHSMVDYVDGSVLAQLGSPDMRTPIAYALAWPDRMPAPSPKLALEEIATLTFEKPDELRFPALRLAREALRHGGSAPTLLNAANEVAVGRFLEGKIKFLDIARIVEATIDNVSSGTMSTLDDVAEADIIAREFATNHN